MASTTISDVNRFEAEAPLLVRTAPTHDPRLIRLFRMVTASRGEVALPPDMTNYFPEALKILSEEMRQDAFLMEVLNTFDCSKRSDATPAEVLSEAIFRRKPEILAPLISQIDHFQLGWAFDTVCARAELEMVQIMLSVNRISSAQLGKGFITICDFGNSDLAALFQWNSKLTEQDLDSGYLKAYHASKGAGFEVTCNKTMETISERVSPEMLGTVFIQACKEGRKDFAKNQVKNPRLKTADLQRGLAAAARNGFVQELTSELPTSTLALLSAYRNRKKLMVGGLLFVATAAAAASIYMGVTAPMPSAPASNILEASLRMAPNLDVLENAQRCCSLSMRFLS